MPRPVMTFVLAIPPVVFVALALGVVALAQAFRKSFGTHSSATLASWIFVVVVIGVHAGYFAAPFLYNAGRATLALWLTMPLAIIATVGVFLYFPIAGTGPLIPEYPTEKLLRLSILLGAPLVYLTPVVILLRANPTG